MKNIKKIISVFMMTAIALSLAVPTFAVSFVTTIEGKDFTIKFNQAVELKTETMGEFQGSLGELAKTPVEVYQVPVGTKITITNLTEHTSWHRQELSGATGVLKTDGTWDNSGIYNFLSGNNGMDNYNNQLVFQKGSTISYAEFMPSEYGVYTLGYYNVDNLSQQKPSYRIRVSDKNTSKPTEISAQVTASTVLVAGKQVAFNAYNIDGNNYFKLRDIAKVLSGTQKQFDVSWDDVNIAINLVSGSPYTVVGGELATGSRATMKATANTSPIFKDTVAVKLTAYNINGNNFFKLRDIGQVFNFAVTWDAATNTINIDTSKAYTA